MVKNQIFALSQNQHITMSIGQVIEIASPGVQKYSIGNKEVISIKHHKDQQKLYIRAKGQGHSDIQLWGKNKRTIKVSVLSKLNQLKVLELRREVSHIRGIKTKASYGKLWILGTIKTIEDYNYLNRFIDQRRELIVPNLKISKPVVKDIISNIYIEFFNKHYDRIECKSSNYKISCLTSSQIFKDKAFINSLQEQYNVEIKSSLSLVDNNNYLIDMRIIQVEQLNGKEIHLGLDGINFSLSEILDQGVSKLEANARLRLEQTQMKISTLARPKLLLSLNEKSVIRVGSDIPFNQTNENNQTITTWKFAGLKIKLNISKSKSSYKVKYETMLTRPIGGGTSSSLISGNKQQSSFQIDLNRPIQAFEIALRTSDKRSNGVPLLNQIPVLRNLFSSKGDSSTHKKIIAIFRLTKE